MQDAFLSSNSNDDDQSVKLFPAFPTVHRGDHLIFLFPTPRLPFDVSNFSFCFFSGFVMGFDTADRRLGAPTKTMSSNVAFHVAMLSFVSPNCVIFPSLNVDAV